MILNELTNADAIEAVREETREATLEEVLGLIKQGLSGDQLEQAIEREHLRMVPQTPRSESFK